MQKCHMKAPSQLIFIPSARPLEIASKVPTKSPSQIPLIPTLTRPEISSKSSTHQHLPSNLIVSSIEGLYQIVLRKSTKYNDLPTNLRAQMHKMQIKYRYQSFTICLLDKKFLEHLTKPVELNNGDMIHTINQVTGFPLSASLPKEWWSKWWTARRSMSQDLK